MSAVTANRSHPFPFRTRKLSCFTYSSVLPNGGKAGKLLAFIFIQINFYSINLQFSMQRDSNRKIALERIEILFELASKSDDKFADRYVYLARKIAMRYTLKISQNLKKKFCHHCYIYFKLNRVTIRTNSKNKAIEYTCSDCKKVTRYGYRQKKNK